MQVTKFQRYLHILFPLDIVYKRNWVQEWETFLSSAEVLKYLLKLSGKQIVIFS